MAKMKIQDRLHKGLMVTGWTEVESTSKKYRTYENPMKVTKVFTGKAGALRVGKTASNSTSYPEYGQMVLRLAEKGSP